MGHKIEHMGEDKLKRLRRLGVVKGARHLKPALPRSQEKLDQYFDRPEYDSPEENPGQENLSLAVLFPEGQVIETDYGSCFVLDQVYPLTHRHGEDSLAGLITTPIGAAATFTRDQRLTSLRPDDLLFLDTETTGLSGAGTIAFMVGVAFIESSQDPSGSRQAFVVRQYFLRDHGDEPAMLFLLSQLLAQRKGLVTFNGRSFDLPLLDTRYLMNRLDGLVGDLRDRPHIDLLPPSRRLWRHRFTSCSLGSLEEKLLGLTRNQEDIPGWAIPGLYLEYLRSRDAREMRRVFYHNQVDMLSMATLIVRILRQFTQPQPGDHPLDLLSLGRWQMAMGQTTEAEKNLQLAATLDLPLSHYQQALYLLGSLLKRADRRLEAVPLWQQIAVTSFDDVSAHLELAKAFEWHLDDLQSARMWTREALKLYESWDGGRDLILQEELLHRLQRLELKIGAR